MNPFYDIKNIWLSDNHLIDPALLALAWKRAHGYIRSVNWYADNFELDQSSLFLQDECAKWAENLNEKAIKLKELELVPAPKSHVWEFVERLDESRDDEPEPHCLVWKPKLSKEQKDEGNAEATGNADTQLDANLALRPLAHIGIQEQTYFTLLMSCLANKVETLQGDPATDFSDVHEKEVVNYGNRLYCIYDENGNAEHNYGATTIFSKYFVDYQQFLKRPYYFAQQQKTEKLPDEEVYIVELDIKQFYDHVDRKKLVSKIEALMERQRDKFDSEKKSSQEQVKQLLESFINWEWSGDAKTAYPVCPKNSDSSDCQPPQGIPQGLVAGGFLANIYLLDMDEYISKFLARQSSGEFTPDTEKEKKHHYATFAEQLNEEEIKIHDYCRYVDDVRLVITAPKLSKCFTLKDLTSKISEFASKFLEKQDLGLFLNKDKTKVTRYQGIPNGISARLKSFQSRMSGPISPLQLDHLISELESLLLLSNDQPQPQEGDSCRVNRLAEIEKSTLDVRDDTIRRFAANKLAKALKEKRHLTSRDVDEQGSPIPGDWDYLQERVARRLIAVWSKDPALVMLLKKGLEMFPSPRLLQPVLEQFDAITQRDKQSQAPKQKAIMDYCLAEIFRHSATVIHKKDLHAIPAHADVSAYFEILQARAATVIDAAKANESDNQWDFLADQAHFLLLTRLDTLLEKPIGNTQQDFIFKLAKGFRYIEPKKDLTAKKIALCILLADQLLEDNQSLIRAAVPYITQPYGNEDSSDYVLNAIAQQNPDLAAQLIASVRLLKSSDGEGYILVQSVAEKLYLDIAPSQAPLEKLTGKQSLVQLFTRPDNPFANEIMAIKLMLELMTASDDNQGKHNKKEIDLAKTTVQQACGYSAVPKYAHIDEPLEVKIDYREPLTTDLLVSTDEEQWLTNEQITLRQIAFVIRAALAGSKDATGFGMSFAPKTGYRGLKSTRSKRQIGLYTTPESLAGEGAQTSGWLTTLLTKLLRWPGIRVNEQGYQWPMVLDKQAVKKLLKERLGQLKQLYCELSQMPVLPELVSPKWQDKADLNVLMVQSKQPAQADFSTDLYLNNPKYRAAHRFHITQAAALATQHIETEGHPADLIIWPELAVHEDDLDVLKYLSQKTHAIIFAGLVFQKDGIGNAINTAIWIVPRKHNGNSNEIMRLQGKQHMTALEQDKVQPWRPYQLVLELRPPELREKKGFMLTGAICYDATDIKLSADLTNKTDTFVISALNKDINTFDSMVEALHYHMYQPVILVNTGEFGGSYAMAPYKEQHDKLIAHNTGKNQLVISNFKLNMFDFRRAGVWQDKLSNKELKTPPAGVRMKRNTSSQN